MVAGTFRVLATFPWHEITGPGECQTPARGQGVENILGTLTQRGGQR